MLNYKKKIYLHKQHTFTFCTFNISDICLEPRIIDIETDLLFDDAENIIGGNGQRPRSPASQALARSGADFEFPDGATKVTLIYKLDIEAPATFTEVQMRLVYADKVNVKVFMAESDSEPVSKEVITSTYYSQCTTCYHLTCESLCYFMIAVVRTWNKTS